MSYCRCSAAFFSEERNALQRKREKLRILQQRKNSDLDDFKDLPDEIPMPLVIGTKVTGTNNIAHHNLSSSSHVDRFVHLSPSCVGSHITRSIFTPL